MPSGEKSALVVGFGMGGFLDFMLLHLILQWHHMISNRLRSDTLEALQRNIFWDGVGQAVMWVITLAGVIVLLRAAQHHSALPTTLWFVGLFVVGWGIFNFLDGTLNHYVFALHNVREDAANVHAWNLGFMIVAGVLLPALGWLPARAGGRTVG